MITIRIDTDTLRNKIDNLKVEKDKIDEVLQRFKGDTLTLGDYWSGDTGDLVNEEINRYTNYFDYISNKLERYIGFLEAVSRAYEEEDKLIEKNIDNNSGLRMI